MIRLYQQLVNGKTPNIKNILIKKLIKILHAKNNLNYSQLYYFNQIIYHLGKKRNFNPRWSNGKVFRISKQIIEILEKVQNKQDKMS